MKRKYISFDGQEHMMEPSEAFAWQEANKQSLMKEKIAPIQAGMGTAGKRLYTDASGAQVEMTREEAQSAALSGRAMTRVRSAEVEAMKRTYIGPGGEKLQLTRAEAFNYQIDKHIALMKEGIFPAPPKLRAVV